VRSVSLRGWTLSRQCREYSMRLLARVDLTFWPPDTVLTTVFSLSRDGPLGGFVKGYGPSYGRVQALGPAAHRDGQPAVHCGLPAP
jgi:hypothetical protein